MSSPCCSDGSPCYSDEGVAAAPGPISPEEALSFSLMAPLAIALHEIREISGALPIEGTVSKIKNRVKCCPKCCLWQRCYACLGKNITSGSVLNILKELKESHGDVVLGMAVNQWCAGSSCKRVDIDGLKVQLDSLCLESQKQLSRIFCYLQDAVKKARRASRPNCILGMQEMITYAVCQCSGLFSLRLNYGSLVDKVRMVGELCREEPLSKIWRSVEDPSSLLDSKNVASHLVVARILSSVIGK